MTSKALICAIAAASFSFASLSLADNDNRRDHKGRHGGNSSHRDDDRRDHRDNRSHQGPRGFDHRDARDKPHYGARGPHFHRGGRIPFEYRNRQYVVNNWRDHRLNAPPRGQQWVQVGSDYVLVAIATGIIAQLVLSR